MHRTGPYQALSFQLNETEAGFIELSKEYRDETQAGHQQRFLKVWDASNSGNGLHFGTQTIYIYTC